MGARSPVPNNLDSGGLCNRGHRMVTCQVEQELFFGKELLVAEMNTQVLLQQRRDALPLCPSMPHFQRSSLLLFAAPPPVAPTTYWTKHPPTLLYYLDFTYLNPNCVGRAPNPAADFCRVAQSSRVITSLKPTPAASQLPA